MQQFLEGLAQINCSNNYKKEKNGKCYSAKCMFNQNTEIANRIKKEGCIVYKKIKKGLKEKQ